MTRLKWVHLTPAHEWGVSRGVFYPKRDLGIAWNGLIRVAESSTDDSQSLIYVDGVGFQNHLQLGSFSAVIEAVTYPDEFAPFDGYDELYSAQSRRAFDFTYQTEQEDGHYKIHLVYNALATPTKRDHNSVNQTPEAETFSWNITTVPVSFPHARPSAHFIFDSKLASPSIFQQLQDWMYGTDSMNPAMPEIQDLFDLVSTGYVFVVVDNGDGTATISGREDQVFQTGPDQYTLTAPTVVQTSSVQYSLRDW